jgi:gluconolactonase
MRALPILFATSAALVTFSAAAQSPAPAPDLPPPHTVVRLDPALDALIAKDATVDLLASDFGSTEGPLWLGGKLYVSDQARGDWLTVGMDGKKTVIASLVGGPINREYRFSQGPNAAIAWKNGSVLVMRQGKRDIGIYRNGKFDTFLSHYEGKRLNAPNDMIATRDGGLYFSDPAFSLPGGPRGPMQETPYQGVYHVSKAGKLTLVNSDFLQPNGIALSVDEKTLYLTDTAGPDVWAFDVNADGTLSNKRNFAHYVRNPNVRGSVDGIKVDARGNIWTTMPGGVEIITPEGKVLGRIWMGQHASNVAFGGPDGKTVFITGGDSVYTVRALVGGRKAMYAR